MTALNRVIRTGHGTEHLRDGRCSICRKEVVEERAREEARPEIERRMDELERRVAALEDGGD